MAEFKKNDRFSGAARRPFSKPSFNKGPSRGSSFGPSRDFGQKELFDAECSKCHDRCQVPFRPNGKKPVFCSKCFTKDDDRSGSSYGHPAKRDFGSSRPAMRTNDYAPQASQTSSTEIRDLKKQMELMTATLEKLVVAVDTITRGAALTKEVRKHLPADKPASAPVRVSTKAVSAPKASSTKKPVKKAARTVGKK